MDSTRDLLAGPAPINLPADPAQDLLHQEPTLVVLRQHPESPLAWAVLAEEAFVEGADDITVYAYARTGYHRSLDLLRRNGWKGHGPVPWEHEPNRGFLRCVAALSRAAGRIGETAEQERCREFLRDSSETAFTELL